MDSFVERVNRGFDPELERELMSEYFYLLQISGALPYLRGRWVVVSILSTTFVILVNVGGAVVLGVGILNTMKKDFSIALSLLHAFCACVLMGFVFAFLALNRRSMIEMITTLKTKHKYDSYVEMMKKEKNLKDKESKIKRNTFKLMSFGLFLLVVQCPYLLHDIAEKFIANIYTNHVPFGLEKSHAKMIYFGLTALIDSVLLLQFLTYIVFISSVFTQVNTELEILIDSINHMEDRALICCRQKYKKYKINDQQMYKNIIFLKEYKLCIKDNIKHHQHIKRLYLSVDNIQRWAFFSGSFNLAVATACTVLAMIKGEGTLIVSIMITLLATETGSFALLCMTAQKLVDLGDELFGSFYRLKWTDLPPHVTKMIIIFQESTKKRLVYRAGGMIEVNWRFFTHVMNLAYTYAKLLFAIER